MNPIVLITGATSGIGMACAERFAANGYQLIICGRRQERLDALKASLQQQHAVKIYTLSFDVQDKLAVQQAIAALPLEWQKIAILVNNAGLSLGLDPIQEGNIEDWEVMIDTNVKGLLYVSRAVMPLMVTQKAGHIVNIGSIAGKETYANGNVYCASKHAVDSLNKAMRIDLLPHAIKVTAIHPGAVETEFSAVRFKGDQERAKNVYLGFEPLIGKDIADAIYYCVTLPQHVTINELTIMPTAQANTSHLIRKN